MAGLLFCILLISLIIGYRKRSKLQGEQNSLKAQMAVLKAEKEDLLKHITNLTTHNTALSKYQGILDTEKKIQEMMDEAELQSRNILYQASQELIAARTKANEIRGESNQLAARMKENAETLFRTNTEIARKIIDDAEARAVEIAGDAYYSLQNARDLEKTANAMKNVIKGYGDQYILPTYTLLDGLAEEFGHVEAGEKLKAARTRTSLMIKTGSAARCDYTEANRRETALRFVIDAFNGKVDSVLARIKKDNYGTLAQQIKDAYRLVNINGKAFRNAVITPEYLDSRLEELKWAVTAMELKWEEQEEQRRIREQMREEEKARREYEKAMRDAQKEEDTLKKLIDKAQKEVLQANEEQKARFEEKLRELEGRLHAAEEKNQRALSMAQQTRSGNVYIISNIGSFGENIYKIGMTRRLEPLDRIRELGDASVPFDFDVHALIYCDDAPNLERELHKKFLKLQMNKVNPRKEFFKVMLNDIRKEVEAMNIEAKWTMTAEARQYKETLAIEEEISQNKEKQLEWERYQEQLDPLSVEPEEVLMDEFAESEATA